MSMSTGERLLTIHCGGPEPIVPIADSMPPKGAKGIVLHFAKLAPHRDHIPAYRASLDPVEMERAARFRFDVDRERFIIAHGLLRKLLADHLDARPADLRFDRGPYGKPFIKGVDLRFNLSDTKDALVVAIGGEVEIGVDVETMARTVDHMAVGEHYFTPEEVEVIASAPEPKRRFLEYWTRKEAVLKASGVGIMDDLRVLRVDGAVNRMTIRHEAFVRHAAEVYHLHTWHMGAEHILSVATEIAFGEVAIHEV
ncbi:MAG: 4'-phosphopantetheinyl transferase superfamily protein [Flavobacteriales bacterium]|nr:4'-phosphopantetheinyl transferase superfamily protein [Flavobacteriales bacterium]